VLSVVVPASQLRRRPRADRALRRTVIVTITPISTHMKTKASTRPTAKPDTVEKIQSERCCAAGSSTRAG
jgi:hypothetical protein